MCLQRDLKPNLILDFPQLEWEEFYTKWATVVSKPNSIANWKSIYNLYYCLFVVVFLSPHNPTYQEAFANAKNSTHQTFMHMQMLKQVHQPPIHEQTMNFHLQWRKESKKKFHLSYLLKTVWKVHLLPICWKKSMKNLNVIACSK